jgi:hypothetical protein
MPRTKGAKQVGAEIDEVLLQNAKDFAKGRGETFREVLEAALRRHMANPPPVKTPPPPPVYPPLPPVPPPGSPAKRQKKK